MAEDFDDLYDIENMNDDELKDLVLQELHDYPEIDVDLIEVNVRNGHVQLTGRVGTEQEIQQVEHVITDVLGISNVSNELVLDELTRGELSEAADDAFAETLAASPERSSTAPRTSDTAEHLMDDIDAEQFGTDDVQEAIERGTSYEPPDRPPQEGSNSRENH